MKMIGMLLLASVFAVAGGKTYDFVLMRDAALAGQTLAAGEYRMEVQESKIVVNRNGKTVEAPVTVHQEPRRRAADTVKLNLDGSGYRIEEIRLPGAGLRIVVNL